ncbi:Wzz/FepE/Etk N-terminal domain-containing protein [Thalassotalea nanhaiensis]|uniref:Wzz/FepE/Etk N-terminal domain-containing protein n=1 Tax=Thalassotalea nanhaiensis TaxID=3065648 RepID=A0ABY9TLT9_9GAMM|nr:Wzz/FepE/Etk N-terminal domain-containing protein [Colwelliaceae bacterium SQ345]
MSNGTQEQQSQQYIPMPQNAVFIPKNNQDDEIDLAELLRVLWHGKVLIIVVTLFFAAASVVYAINQPNTYKASALLSPAQSSSGAGGLSALAGQFGGLASMAGINLGGQEQDKTGLALEILKSRAFIEAFIKDNNLLAPLMASESWDVNTNKLIYNETIFQIETKQWVREVKYPKTPQPSLWEAFEEFKKHLIVSEDVQTGMIKISIEHYSPEIAKSWLTLIIAEINQYMRIMDKTEAQNSIDFLTEKLEQTQLSGMQTVFYQLIEEQTKTMMLTEVSDEYVFKTIDPPNVPDEKSGPQRALICILVTMIGGILAVLLVLIRHFSAKPIKEIDKQD